MTRKLILHRAKSFEGLVKSRKGRLIAVVRIEADKSGVQTTVDTVDKASKQRRNVVSVGRYPSGFKAWYYADSPQYLFFSLGQNSPPGNFWRLDEITLPVAAKALIRECRRRGLLLLNDSKASKP